EQRQFRNINWNMTRDEVLKNETAELNQHFKDTSALMYDNVGLLNKKFSLVYTFKNSKLKEASYICELNSFDNIEATYLEFKETLTSKYGTPISDILEWREPLKSIPNEKRIWYSALLMN